jgi:3-vinyl bacteriochlorophyllide hydratase
MATYTSEQLARRDASVWTRVQAILAPAQFLAFLISLALVVHYLVTGRDYMLATVSVVIKIGLLWAITITGMLWEKKVFGRYFLARQFFWEDLGNAVAILSHNLYFVAQALGWSRRAVMVVMLVAYCTYLVNCAQFVVKGVQTARQRRVSSMALDA